MEKKKNLFRIDTGRTHGWQVRIVRDGERHTKLFSDPKYGVQGALNEAAETLTAHTDHDLTVDEMIETARPAVEQLLADNDVAERV
jgi:hypothetical protein